MYQCGIEKEDKIVFIDGEITNMENNQNSLNIASLSNVIELLEKNVETIENEDSSKNCNTLFQRLIISVTVMAVSLPVALMASYLTGILFDIIFGSGISFCVIGSVISFIKYGKSLTNMKNEITKKK